MAVTALPLEALCEDCNTFIFYDLGSFDLTQRCSVNRAWQEFAGRDDVWRHAVPGIEKFAQTDVKKYVLSHAVWSEEVVERRMKKFVSRVLLNQKSTFECFFPFNPVCEVFAEFGYGYCSKEDVNPAHTEVCVFLKKPLEGELRKKGDTIRGVLQDKVLNATWSFLKPHSFMNSRVILYADWEEAINDKTLHIWSCRKHELSEQFKKQNEFTWDSVILGVSLLGSFFIYGSKSTCVDFEPFGY